MKINDGGPAFPKTGHEDTTWSGMSSSGSDGMSLRDHLACKAMEILLRDGEGAKFTTIACDAYELADAMLRAREAS